ncbi:MAG: hypothetical protein A3G17_05265 [Planctomycetes bacterium RIFCSPLOWO2_12_FULL_50_35]|nr:MAG: hypothetical protein A3G17_05265 [Planctomycetes bacterium RIFCSPLOWO2_12_FULL_50_35]
MLHFMLDFVGLILSSVALTFVLSAKRNGKLKNVNKAIFFLALDIGIEVVEDAVRWLKKITFTADGVTLEIVTLTLTILALYYVVSAKDKKKVELLMLAAGVLAALSWQSFWRWSCRLPLAYRFPSRQRSCRRQTRLRRDFHALIKSGGHLSPFYPCRPKVLPGPRARKLSKESIFPFK